MAPTLPAKVEKQRELRRLESRRDEAWRAYDQASRALNRQKDTLLDGIGRSLEQHTELEPLFTPRWCLT